MSSRRRRLALAGASAVAALLGQGCGAPSGPQGVLGSAMSHIGDIRAGGLSARFTLAPNANAANNTVGIIIQGSFALDQRRRLPVLHVTYTELAGARTTTARLDSDGRLATIRTGGRLVHLDAAQQQLLAATLQGPQGLGNLPLHIDRWVDHARQAPGPTLGGQPTDQITGTVNLPSALNDLNQLSGGQVNQATRSNSASNALAKNLRSSTFLAVVGHEDHLLRRLNLRVVLVPVLRAAATGPPAQGLTVVLAVTLTPQPLPH